MICAACTFPTYHLAVFASFIELLLEEAELVGGVRQVLGEEVLVVVQVRVEAHQTQLLRDLRAVVTTWSRQWYKRHHFVHKCFSGFKQ